MINSRFRNDVEDDTNVEDAWEYPIQNQDNDPPDIVRTGEGSNVPLVTPVPHENSVQDVNNSVRWPSVGEPIVPRGDDVWLRDSNETPKSP